MKSEHSAFQVEDTPAMADWYCEQLGFSVKRSKDDPKPVRFLADETGQVMLEIYNSPAVETPDYKSMHPLLLHLAFVCTDVEDLEGTSMAPLLNHPEQPWKKAAFSQYPRAEGKTMGYSMRTDRYRYTEWRDMKSGQIKDRELCDQQDDPKENTNVSGKKENWELVASLANMLSGGYQSAKP